MIQPVIAGNWKMNKTVPESLEFAARLLKAHDPSKERKVIIAPPFTALHAVAGVLRGSSVHLAAQNLHEAEKGAYTGEISGEMLLEAGCSHVIVGHSERRTLFTENNARINRKLLAALSTGLESIFCVGESLQQREDGQTQAIIEQQLKEGLNKFTISDMNKILIAYEPVWAIGTGKTASPEQAQEIHFFIRDWISRQFGSESGSRLPILYGGSVTPKNIAALMAQPDIDGALVGGASLDVDSFIQLINY
jgi:triosephosphate isomerase